MGPLFITLHSAFKFHGIVSVSYYSMMAVMISGFLGRYIYMQIPRDAKGTELSKKAIEEQIESLGELLTSEYEVGPELLALLNQQAAGLTRVERRGAARLLFIFASDLLRPFRAVRLRRSIRTLHPQLPPKAIHEIVRLAGKRSTLMRRRAVLDTVCAIFHYWHVIHKPFAWVMIFIMLVHVSVVVAMGYHWIF